MATLADVAQLSGFSIATVSRVLANSEYPVSANTRDKVQTAAKELGYYPNLVSRSLITNNSRDIGVVLPNTSNIYYLQLINGILDTAKQLNYTVTLMSSYRSVAAERDNMIRLMQKQIDGVLVVPIDYQNKALSELMERGIKAVVLEQDCRLDCGKVLFDFAQGTFLSTKHLIELGHQRIAFFSAPFRQKSRSLQLAGYKKALEEYGLGYDEERVFIAREENDSEESYEYSNGIGLAQLMLKRFGAQDRPTAVVCINDMTAIGALHHFQKCGLRVPQDISLVGFDNILVSQTSNPALTTVDQCVYQMGSLAVQMLVSSLSGNGGDAARASSVLLQPTLVERESTSPPIMRL